MITKSGNQMLTYRGLSRPTNSILNDSKKNLHGIAKVFYMINEQADRYCHLHYCATLVIVHLDCLSLHMQMTNIR